MSAIHTTPFEGAGKTYRLTNGREICVEDFWDRVYGEEWALSPTMAAISYAFRRRQDNLPLNDEVVYGKVDSIGHIVHISELAEVLS